MQLGVLLVVVVAGVCLCQDCSFPTNDDLEEVIVNIIRLGDSSSIPIVTIARFHPVCLAFGAQQDRYRLVSVVVEYTCSGHTNCPSGTAVEQIESECGSGIWSNTVLSSTDNTRSVPPDASFNTTTREDCSFCLTAELANNIIGVTTDNVTHCVACDSACSEGLMRCYEFDSDDCCLFYNDGMCVDSCTSPLIPDDNFNCVCPGFFIYPACIECGLECENGGTPLETNCTECNCPPGYTTYNCSEDIDECSAGSPCQNGGTCMNTFGSFTCSCTEGFTGPLCGMDIDECVYPVGTTGQDCSDVIDCGPLGDPANGEVLLSSTTFNSTATYSCNTGYTLTGDDMRMCLGTGLWSDSEPTCGAQSDLHDMCSDKFFVVIVVLAVLLFISLTLNVILVVWIICRATRHKEDSVTQDVAMQENVAYARINIR